MRLYLVNPGNPVVSLNQVQWNRVNKCRDWKPLGLLVVAGLTPPDWEVTVIDEKLGHPNYRRLPKPDLAGITAFTGAGAASLHHRRHLPLDGNSSGDRRHPRDGPAPGHADAVVTGEAESAWGQVLADVRDHALRRVYEGGVSGMEWRDLVDEVNQYHRFYSHPQILKGMLRLARHTRSLSFVSDRTGGESELPVQCPSRQSDPRRPVSARLAGIRADARA